MKACWLDTPKSTICFKCHLVISSPNFPPSKYLSWFCVSVESQSQINVQTCYEIERGFKCAVGGGFMDIFPKIPPVEGVEEMRLRLVCVRVYIELHLEIYIITNIRHPVSQTKTPTTQEWPLDQRGRWLQTCISSYQLLRVIKVPEIGHFLMRQTKFISGTEGSIHSIKQVLIFSPFCLRIMIMPVTSQVSTIWLSCSFSESCINHIFRVDEKLVCLNISHCIIVLKK